MSGALPSVPPGTGAHPVVLVVLSASRLSESASFYTAVFGWPMQKLSAEVTAAGTPTGPPVALRTKIRDGFPGMVAYLDVPDVAAMLDRIVAAGGAVERAPWPGPMGSTMAAFTDPSGTIWGVASGMRAGEVPRVVMPMGGNPRPPVGGVCSMEMYAADGAVAARFFGDLFGWGSAATMPPYLAFDPGAGVGGVFQSHTPALRAVAYIYSADVATTLTAVEAAGGKRLGDPMTMPGMATFGYFTDPSGTTVGLIGP